MENAFKRAAMSPSAGIDNNLPPEITEAILSFLPAKSLGRFKSVSKAWTSLISDPRFIKNHVHQTQNNHHLNITNLIVRCMNSRYSIKTKELLPLLNVPLAAKKLSFGSPPIRIYKILGSCNGLVLVKTNLLEEDVVLINPTTRELWNVPSPPFKYKAWWCYGFGYDSFTDNYKVVYITDSEMSYLHASVYSLRKNSWNILPNSPLKQDAYDLLSSAMVNHICHWSATQSTILTLSLADEVFNVIILPELIQSKNSTLYSVVELGGKLGVCLMAAGQELWVMQEYGNHRSWTRVWSENVLCLHTPVCFVEGSNRGIMMVGKGGLLVFNIDDDESTYKTIRIKGDPVILRIEGTFVESIETLARFVTTPNLQSTTLNS